MIGLVVVSLMWGSTATLIKIALAGASPLYVTAARVITSSLVLLPIAWHRLRRNPSRGRATRENIRHLMVLSIVLVLAPYALASWGQQYVTASLASVLNATIPLWTIIFAALHTRTSPRRRQAIGIITGLAGVVVLVGLHPSDLQADTLLAVAALSVASASRGFGYLYLHHNVSQLPPLQIAATTQSMAAAMLLPVLADTGGQAFTPGTIGALAALGVIATAGAQLLNYHNIARLGPTTASLSTYLISIFGVAIAVVSLGEALTAQIVAGTAIILGSVALAFRRDPKPQTSDRQPASSDPTTVSDR